MTPHGLGLASGSFQQKLLHQELDLRRLRPIYLIHDLARAWMTVTDP